MTRVLLFGTHFGSSNGYSLVCTHLAKYLALKKDIELTWWGFQNFQRIPNHDKEREIPSNVQVYDAFANEKVRAMGFGFEEVTEFVTMNKPDVCIIYNDMVVVSNIIDKLKKVENRKFKIVVYVDQVYLCQKKEFIKRLNDDADFVICFSKYWEDCIKEQGLTVPTGILEHGFNPLMTYPVPKKLARMYFNLKPDDFIIINANRNQPRKRLDLMMMAFAEIVSRHLTDPIKLLIATAPQGAWNLIEIYERELRLRGITLEEGMKHLIFIDNPQGLSDEDMNTLYNAADIGINTAMGEGWGLCNFQAAAIGTPQIVPYIGGFRDFFDSENAVVVHPKVKVYTDMTIDGCPGCAEICDANDFADAIEAYYADDTLRKKHIVNARKRILKNYKWSDLVDKLYRYIKIVVNEDPDKPVVSSKEESISKDNITLDEINKLMGKIDDNEKVDDQQVHDEKENLIDCNSVVDIDKIVSPSESFNKEEPVTLTITQPTPQPTSSEESNKKVPPQIQQQQKKEQIRNRLKEKLEAKRKLKGGAADLGKELQKLKSQIAELANK